MRNPSLAKKEGDLSRLTTSSSSSSSRENSSIYLPESEIITPNFTSTYLPEVIDPGEWQTSRKRKERQDSTSSTTQDKKLVRSNSEEYIPSVDYEVIRRVVSHEEFKHPLQDKTNGNVVQQQQSLQLQEQQQQQQLHSEEHGKISPNNNEVQEILKETHKRTEVSPARSRTFDFSHKQRISPHRDGRQCSKTVDDADGEHERRRSSERFCKARAQPGRKSQNSKKSNRYLASKLRERDENVYKYDITMLKGERRGFISKSSKWSIGDENRSINVVTRDEEETMSKQDYNENNLNDIYTSNKSTSSDILPWDQSCPDDTPVICPRFSDSVFDHVAQSRNAKNVSLSNAAKSIGGFVSMENMKTREIMQNVPPPNLFSSPEERLKQINKRLVALKKRVANFEEAFERQNGYRPSQSEKLNDKFTKYALAEIHKLRRDKQQIKSDPAAAVGIGTSQKGGNKVVKMKETLAEVERRLQEKRNIENRPLNLDDLSPEQLVQEKTAIQRALLYLESLFGRPNTKDERDAARSLYDRYRAIKRTINRSASLTVSVIAGSELPTIHEHEAMHFPMSATQAILLLNENTATIGNQLLSSTINSPTDTSQSVQSTDSSDTTSSSVHENVHTMSVDELRKQLEIARDEKKELRRTIKEFEELFEERNGRKMLKSDRIVIEDTYMLYKQKKAKLRLLDALIRKHNISK